MNYLTPCPWPLVLEGNIWAPHASTLAPLPLYYYSTAPPPPSCCCSWYYIFWCVEKKTVQCTKNPPIFAKKNPNFTKNPPVGPAPL